MAKELVNFNIYDVELKYSIIRNKDLYVEWNLINPNLFNRRDIETVNIIIEVDNNPDFTNPIVKTIPIELSDKGLKWIYNASINILNLLRSDKIYCKGYTYYEVYRMNELVSFESNHSQVVLDIIEPSSSKSPDIPEEPSGYIEPLESPDIPRKAPPIEVNIKLGMELIVDANGYLTLIYYYLQKKLDEIDFENLYSISVKSKNKLLLQKNNEISWGINNEGRLYIRIINEKYPAEINGNENLDCIAYSSDILPSNGIGINDIIQLINNNVNISIDGGFIIEDFYNQISQPIIGGIENRNSTTKLNNSLKSIYTSSINLYNCYTNKFLDNGLNDFELSYFRYYNSFLNWQQIQNNNNYQLITNSDLDIRNNIVVEYNFNNLNNNNTQIIDLSGKGNHGLLVGDMELMLIDSNIKIIKKDLPIIKNIKRT